jgi:hypothetical protein
MTSTGCTLTCVMGGGVGIEVLADSIRLRRGGGKGRKESGQGGRRQEGGGRGRKEAKEGRGRLVGNQCAVAYFCRMKPTIEHFNEHHCDAKL